MLNITKSSFLVLLLIMALTMPMPVTAAWSNLTNLTNQHGGVIVLPSIAQMSNNDVWVVWQEKRSDPRHFDIYSKVYNGTTGTWPTHNGTKLQALSTPNPVHDTAPFIMQTRNGAIWVFWATDALTPNTYDVAYKRSYDYGLSWTDIDYAASSSQRDQVPSAMEASNGTIWVVWQRKAFYGDPAEIYTRTRTGASWSSEVQLTNSSRADSSPSIVQAKNGSIIVFWSAEVYGEGTSGEIMYRVYNGSSWKPEQQVTYDSSLGPDDYDPSAVLTRTGAIWVVWERASPPNFLLTDLYYASSEDNGNTWSPPNQITLDGTNSWPSVTQGNDKRLWITFASDRDVADELDIFTMTSDPLLYHDVAVTSISLSETSVYQGANVLVTVNAENQGDYDEIFTVECYANSTLLGSEIITLPPQNSTTLVWNMSDFAPGSYTISANASAVPDEDVINMDDNLLIGGTVQVKIPGDVNGDGTVDILDLNRVEAAYGATPGDSGWDEEADINRDGIVDALDLALVGKHYGETV